MNKRTYSFRLSAFFLAGLALTLGLVLTGCRENRAEDLPFSQRIGNCQEVVAGIRQGLKNHAKTITITFDYGSDIFNELNQIIDDWVDAALAETEDPAEGDYLRYQYGGYTYSSSYTLDDRWHYVVTLTPDYYCYLSQEQQASDQVDALMKEFGFWPWTSQVQRITVIYDYLCRTVRYDKVHGKNPYYHTCSTAYAALVLHNATCQGYCVSLYRLLREAGIDCRIVTGTATGEEGVELHAWVIARVENDYYNLDPTWDAGSEEYRWFLIGQSEFADHIPGEAFQSPDFLDRYPLAEHSYDLSH